MTASELEDLQLQWKSMFQQTLPVAATSRSNAQPRWPVHVDHCFARIILDNVVGKDAPWMQKLKSPAYKNMSMQELKESIKMGEDILAGDADLVALDNESLRLRGKTKGGSGKIHKGELDISAATSHNSSGKRKRADVEAKEPRAKIGDEAPTTKKPKKADAKVSADSDDTPSPPLTHEQLLAKISASRKTPYQKSVLTALMQVPRGSYTTYGAIAKHLKSSARAVGNGLKNNQFAPAVPCHRVLASDGGLGGFGGSWGRNGEEGKNDEEKRRLLREEGVKFGCRGKVVGTAWEGFQ